MKEENILDILPIEDKLTIANNMLKLMFTEEEYDKFCDIVKKLTP